MRLIAMNHFTALVLKILPIVNVTKILVYALNKSIKVDFVCWRKKQTLNYYCTEQMTAKY